MVHCVRCSMAKKPNGQSHFRDEVFRLRNSGLTLLGGFPALSQTKRTFLRPGTVFFERPITIAYPTDMQYLKTSFCTASRVG